MSSATYNYKRADIEGGEINDPVEIGYFKAVQANDVIENKLLGDYNENGNYIIKKVIVSELINVTKLMQHSYGKTLFCTSVKEAGKYGLLQFAVKINKNSPKAGEATATLELLEPIDRIGGYYQNINTSLIAQYTAGYTKSFLQEVYKAFAIILKEDDYKGRKKIEDTMEEIIARKDYLTALQKLSNMKLSQTEKAFYESRIKALKKSGEAGKIILNELNSEIDKIAKLFLDPKQPNYFKKMNELLDKVLQSNKKITNNELQEELDNAKLIYAKEFIEITESIRAELLKQQLSPKEISAFKEQMAEQAQNKAMKLTSQARIISPADKIQVIGSDQVEQVVKAPIQKVVEEVQQEGFGVPRVLRKNKIVDKFVKGRGDKEAKDDVIETEADQKSKFNAQQRKNTQKQHQEEQDKQERNSVF
jgi:hypothetical protein